MGPAQVGLGPSLAQTQTVQMLHHNSKAQLESVNSSKLLESAKKLNLAEISMDSVEF